MSNYAFSFGDGYSVLIVVIVIFPLVTTSHPTSQQRSLSIFIYLVASNLTKVLVLATYISDSMW